MSLINDAAVVEELKQHFVEYVEINDNGTITPPILWTGAKVILMGK